MIKILRGSSAKAFGLIVVLVALVSVAALVVFNWDGINSTISDSSQKSQKQLENMKDHIQDLEHQAEDRLENINEEIDSISD